MLHALSFIGCLLLSIALNAAEFKVASVSEIQKFFKGQEKQVLTFIGYSGAEYENKVRMLKIAEDVLAEFDPKTTIVNIGATPEGIGAIYALAKKMGFETSGIVSSQARDYLPEKPAEVDHVFFVQDESWGGYLADGTTLSPTSEAMLSVSEVLIGIGGNDVGRDELLEAQNRGKTIRFFTADMNHEIAIAKAKKNGKEVPTDFRGSAHLDWFSKLENGLRSLINSCGGLKKK